MITQSAFEIRENYQRLADVIALPLFRSDGGSRCFFNSSLLSGRLADLTSLASHGHAIVEGEPLVLELTQDLVELIAVHGGFGSRSRKREKVEWSGAGRLNRQARERFCKESRSLIWFSSSGSDWIRNHF